jgi:predicted RNA-binding protein
MDRQHIAKRKRTNNTIAKRRRTDNTIAKRRRTDNTIAKGRRTDNTIAKRRRTDNTIAKRGKITYQYEEEKLEDIKVVIRNLDLKDRQYNSHNKKGQTYK